MRTVPAIRSAALRLHCPVALARHRREAITVGLIATTLAAVAFPEISTHCTVGGLFVNLFWVWE